MASGPLGTPGGEGLSHSPVTAAGLLLPLGEGPVWGDSRGPAAAFSVLTASPLFPAVSKEFGFALS